MLNGRQVRACVDCGWNMTTEEISANALCDLGLFRAFHRAANSGLASPDSVSDLTTSSTSPSSRWMSPLMFDPSVDDSGDGARSWLSEHKSELLAVQDSPSLLFVTTESGYAGKAITDSLKSRYPSLAVVSSEEGHDLSSVKFTHSANSKSKLDPVLNWWLLGEFEFIAGCGTTYSITAAARRSLLPSSFVVHEHHPPPPSLWRQPGKIDAQIHPADDVTGDAAPPPAAVTVGVDTANDSKSVAVAIRGSGGGNEERHQQGRAFHNPDGNIGNLYPEAWMGCLSVEVLGRRWLN
mmetsp:Transcript_32484/g.54746  ORF Transcript_32484/g.54746 Transcript_32484/m.54746 type:complete len:294 (-) Transcript_32484:363-1244(-)